MKLFYYCFARAHSSVIAGYIHLGKLPQDRIPAIKEIMAIPEFDKTDSSVKGIPYLLGKDHQNHEIYLIGFGKDDLIGIQTIHHFLQQNANPAEWRFFNALSQIGYLTKLGGFLSRNLKITLIGRFLAAWGIQRSYFRLVQLVKTSKESIQVPKRRIVVVTDGDRVAKKVVEKVAQNIGGRAISLSAGNPTEASGEKITAAIQKTPFDPVLVMVDDCGNQGEGRGEKVLKKLAAEPDIEILGVVAVASNTAAVEGVPITASITREGKVINLPVDKNGYPEPEGHCRVEGDTVDIINSLNIPIVIGVGDLGKMEDADLVEEGAKITTIAVQEVLKRSHFSGDFT